MATRTETMTVNMGPQHPSTHGVLRIVLEIDGETVVSADPTIGFLHTAAVHEATFDALVAEAAPAATTVVVIDDSLLADARERGADDPGVRAGIRRALDDLAARGAPAPPGTPVSRLVRARSCSRSAA